MKRVNLFLMAMCWTALKQYDLIVDYAIPWDIPHSGDYDLEELFDWAMDVVSKTPSKSEAREIRVITD